MSRRGRKPREAPNPTVVLAIAKSIVVRWSEAGQKFSTLNTDAGGRKAIGIVLDGAYICEKCSEWLMRGKDHIENVCPDCKQKPIDAVR